MAPPTYSFNFAALVTRFLSLNWLLVGLLVVWSSISLVLLYSADGGVVWPNEDLAANGWVYKQFLRLCLGFGVMFALAMSPLRIWQKLAYPLYGIALGLLILVDIFGHIGMGAQRWLNLGLFNIQPSELMKPALLLALARYCHQLDRDDIAKPLYLLPPLLMIALPFLLVLRQPDLGTALLLSFGGFAILFLAGLRFWKIAVVGALGLASLPIAWEYVLHGYQKKRIEIFLNSDLDPLGAGYHITQSKIALGAGGIFGRGLLNGSQSKYNFLPEKHTDFIFTLLGEEFGLMGTLTLLLVFVLILGLSYLLAQRGHSQFGRLLAFGMAINFSLYVMVNIAMVTGLVPIVGVPLAIISYGGTAILSVLSGFGFILMADLDREETLSR